jgi:hypothetical protein
MKQVLFILLVFISFQGFSQVQTVKLKEIGLEVVKTDLGLLDWKEAKASCKKLGNGWRLPTMEELKKIYELKWSSTEGEEREFIGGFQDALYWSSTEGDGNNAWYFGFDNEANEYYVDKNDKNYVRAVRTLK